MVKRNKPPYPIDPATMTVLEAQRVAFDPPYTWPSETLDRAARVLTEWADKGRDEACYVQLCRLKASLQRIERAITRAAKDPELLIVAAGLCEVPEL